MVALGSTACRGDDDTDVARAEVVVLDEDSLRGRIAAQIWVRQRLCSAAVLEVYLA